MALEMSRLEPALYEDLLWGLNRMEKASPRTIARTIREYTDRARAWWAQAEECFTACLNTRNGKDLASGLRSVDVASAYWKIVSHCMLNDYVWR